MKVIPLLFICITFSTLALAQENAKEDTVRNDLPEINSRHKLFFNYDAVEFYFTNYDPAIAQKNYEHLGKTKIDTLKRQVIYGKIPTDSNDVFFFENFSKIEFRKRELDTSTFKYLNTLFRERDTVNYTHHPCVRIYRDILVFKKNEKVVGVVKICFECDEELISGTSANISGFGFSEDFEMLKKILRRK